MWNMTAAAVLGAWGMVAAAPPVPVATLPPCVAPIPHAAPDRPPAPLSAVLAQLGAAQYAPAPRGPTPAAGSATESEALRRYVRAQLRRQDGQPRRAADDLDAALRLDPSSPALHRARADAAADAGELSRAVAEWEAVLALDPSDRQAALAVAMAVVETGQFQRAAALLGPIFTDAAAAPAPTFNDSAHFALGATLSRALLRLGCDEAALGPAEYALAIDPADLAAERGDGLDPAVRATAALGREAGEAALRLGRWETAADLLNRSVAYVPEVRTQALAAFASFGAGRRDDAHAVLVQLLARGAPSGDAQTLLAEWILAALGGDPEIAQRMATLIEQAPADGRIARLLAAAAPSRGAQILEGAVAQGAVDRATLHAAFKATGDAAAVALAVRTLRIDPSLTRTVGRELARAWGALPALRAGMLAAPECPEREALRASVAAFERDSGSAWALAEAAHAEWPDEPAVFFALVEAAASAADPALVQRAIVDAPPLLETDPNWHAAVARAAVATGLDELASASLARCDALDPGSESAAQLRAAAAGSAPSWSARGRAEQAMARGELSDAAAALMEARALDPDDDAALGMLMRVLPRTVGPRATLDWAESEVSRVPNDPLLWEALALQAIAAGRGSAALASVDTRLAADPSDTAVVAAREALLRANGQNEAALLSARARTAALPPGPRRALEQASVEAQGGDSAAAVDALRTFAESAFPPPLGMRAAALDVLRRLPPTPERAAVMRRIARDAILADPSAPLEFFAFEALSAASDPALSAESREEFAGMIGEEAAAAPLHRKAESSENWRAACDFLAAQGHPAEAAEFLRARLDDPTDLEDADLVLLSRAAFAADALAGKGTRAEESMHLLGRLRALGRQPLEAPASHPAAAYTELSAIYTLVGDSAGSERILEAACSIDPDDPVALNNLAYARAQRGLLDDRTLEMARKAVAGRADEYANLDTLGWVLYLRGQVADTAASASQAAAPGALATLLRAVERAGRGGSGDLYIHLGDAQWRAGDHSGAATSWKAARDRSTAVGRDQALALYRQVLRRQTGLAAVDAGRLYEEHDASVAERAKARLDAIAAGSEPQVTPMVAAPAAPSTAQK